MRAPLAAIFVALIAAACTSSATDAGLMALPCDGGCATGQTCFQGKCDSDCAAAGGLQCGASCVTPSSDDQNCGACGNICVDGQFCLTGMCVSTCPAGLSTCTRDGGLTYCTDLAGDVQNCGACGAVCPSAQVCSDGGCLALGGCPSSQTLCPLPEGGSICADLSSDTSFCGSCTTACSTWETCGSSVCVGPTSCPTGLQLCTSTSGATVCANLQTDLANCGHCGDSCGGTGGECTDGACSCRQGFAPCAATGGSVCADLSQNLSNCGACGQSCVTGEGCLLGECYAKDHFVPSGSVGFANTDAGTTYLVGVAIGDFNNDGNNDLAVIAVLSGVSSIGSYATNLEIDFGDGTGTFPSSTSYDLAYPVSGVAVGDVNGDGLSDIVLAILGTEGSYIGSGFLVLQGLSDGGRTMVGPFESNPGETTTSSSNGTVGVLVADFNTDGIDDVAIANPGEGVDIFYGLRDGGFDKVSQVFSGVHSGWPPEMSAGDLNGDGRTDLSVLTDSTFGVLLQTADGGLGAGPQLGAFEGVGVITGQFLVAADFFAYTLTLYRLNAGGTLDYFTSYQVPGLAGVDGIGATLAVDFNRDGIPDLVVSGYSAAALWLSHGPDAGFDVAVNLDLGGYAAQMAAGDLNGDGRPDIAVADTTPAPATEIFLNQY